MRARLIVGVSLVITGTLATIPVTAQLLGTKPKPGLTVWADADYKGSSTTFTADTPDISASGLGKAISSLRVGPGESWQVCSEPNYTGNCRTFSAAVANLQTARLNDAIMSVRHAPAAASTGRGTATAPAAGLPTMTSRTERSGTTGLELYPDTNFGGDVQILREAVSDFRELNFSDRAMSLRVPANQTWEVCNHVDFDDCRLVSGNVADLASIGFSRVISSARPHPGNNVSGRSQIVFYDNTNYRGRSVIVDEDRQVMNSSGTAVGSLRVFGGEWQVCDRPRFYGNCVVVTQDVTDYSRLGLRGPVASARRNQDR